MQSDDHLGYLVITVQVVHPEGEVELLHAGVQLVLLRVLLDGPEVGQHAHKVLQPIKMVKMPQEVQDDKLAVQKELSLGGPSMLQTPGNNS